MLFILKYQIFIAIKNTWTLLLNLNDSSIDPLMHIKNSFQYINQQTPTKVLELWLLYIQQNI